MILIGTTELRRTRSQGDFRCPECRQQRHYRLKSVRPFLTLYFIPTIPVGASQEYVECEKCGEAFDPQILTVNPEAAERLEQEQFHSEVMNAAVLTVVSDGEITEGEIAALGKIGSKLFDRTMSREELGQLCASATQVGFKPQHYLQSIVNRWDRDQKYFAMKMIFLATSADGDLTDEQLAALVEIRKTLSLTKDDFESAVEEAVAISSDYDR